MPSMNYELAASLVEFASAANAHDEGRINDEEYRLALMSNEHIDTVTGTELGEAGAAVIGSLALQLGKATQKPTSVVLEELGFTLRVLGLPPERPIL